MALSMGNRDPANALKYDIMEKLKRRRNNPDHLSEFEKRFIDPKEREIKAAISLQLAWKQRLSYLHLKALKQQKLCRDRREEMRAGLQVDCEPCASAGKESADIMFRYLRKAWKDTDKLLFEGIARVQMCDRGDNWNERWQEALILPNITPMEKKYRKSSLDAVYSDFVHTARTYGRTIISEYFLHEYLKSVRAKKLGGVAGGKKYLWRGILFKLADGSKGPYGGSDEAAAKAAGHELRGASEYLKTGVGLCVPPMCLLDYKGFRMLAQAELPINDNTQRMGTNDGGVTVLNECPELNKRTAKAAERLGLRAHTVGGSLKKVRYMDASTGETTEVKRNVGGKVLYAAADVEGHMGKDGRPYLIDLARAFPPEDPSATPHLSGMLSVSAKVVVGNGGKKGTRSATVTKAHGTLLDYDILYPDGVEDLEIPVHELRDLRLFVFYRLMRPEFVRDRGREVLKVTRSPIHEFPKIVISNPMKFAIECAKLSTPKVARSIAEPPSSRLRYAAATPGMPTAIMPVEPRQRSSSSLASSEAITRPYEQFEWDGDNNRYESADVTEGSDRSGNPEAALAGSPSDEAWRRKAMECGIEFVVREDEYYQGFEKWEVEADEEELKQRGGAGYRPFDAEAEHDPQLGYDGMMEEELAVGEGRDGADGPGLYASEKIENGGGRVEEGARTGRSASADRNDFYRGGSADGLEGVDAGEESPDDDGYGGFESESNASSIFSASGSSFRRGSYKITPASAVNFHPESRVRDEHPAPIARYYGRFSKESLLSGGNSSRGNYFQGSFRGSFRGIPFAGVDRVPPEYQASPSIRSGESGAAGYDAFRHSGSIDSMSDISNSQKSTRANGNGTTSNGGVQVEGYAIFDPHGRHNSNGSLASPGLHVSPRGLFHSMGAPKDSGKNMVVSSKKTHRRGRLSNGSNIWDDETEFLQGVSGDLPPPTLYDDFRTGSDRTIANGHHSLKDSSVGTKGVDPPQAPPGVHEEVDVQAEQVAARGSPVPLSPDALTAFAMADPQAKERNREVTKATEFLLKVLVPATAELLCRMPPEDLAEVNLASELHRYGVNMRHIGLLRAYVPSHPTAFGRCAKSKPSATSSAATAMTVGGDEFLSTPGRVEGSSAGDGRRPSRRGGGRRRLFAGQPSTAIMRDRALVEVVVRTLKLVLREFQRRWMKAEQSSSEQGIHMLVAEFLNLVTGSHKKSELFWRENVTTGVCQRFGTVALTECERAGLWDVCSERPELLYMIVKELIEVTGIRFKESVKRTLWRRRYSLKNFVFELTDIRDIDLVVTPMAVFADIITNPSSDDEK